MFPVGFQVTEKNQAYGDFIHIMCVLASVYRNSKNIDSLETANHFSFQENKKTIWFLFNLSEVEKRNKRNLNFLSVNNLIFYSVFLTYRQLKTYSYFYNCFHKTIKVKTQLDNLLVRYKQKLLLRDILITGNWDNYKYNWVLD